MNDELNNQLSSQWRIPNYAQGMLWVETPGDTVQAEGEFGRFTLSAPAEIITLRWGGAEGPALTQLRWTVDTLDWQGTVQIGGFVDAMHITEALDLPEPVTVLTVGGQPLHPRSHPYPGINQRRRVPYPVPAFGDSVAEEITEGVSTWIVFAESPVAVMAQDALVSKLRVHCFGSLADQDAGWHDYFALPIALEALTIFPP
jgi:hypothetical protein